MRFVCEMQTLATAPRGRGGAMDRPGWHDHGGAHAPTLARSSVRMRTRSYAALVNVKIHATFSRPR